jgi:ABC-type spermidine/putrescine transport system permease subunit I
MATYINIEPPIGLFEKIIKRLHREERILVLKRVALFSTTLIISTIGFFPSFNMLVSDFSQSGFLRFFSLMFSDFSTVTTYWQSFGMILLETLPAISLALFLAVLVTFLQSIKSLSRDVKTIIRATA